MSAAAFTAALGRIGISLFLVSRKSVIHFS